MAISGYTATDFGGSSTPTGQKFDRKLLLTFVNVAAFGTNYSSTPTWELIGSGVEDSSIEYNISKEKVTDILGVTESQVTAIEPTQSFSPMTVKKGSKLHFKLTDILERNAKSELSLFEVMVVRAHIEETDSTDTVYHAEKHTGCTISPESEGGSAYIDMPISIDFSNAKTLGTVASLTSPTFTALSTPESTGD